MEKYGENYKWNEDPDFIEAKNKGWAFEFYLHRRKKPVAAERRRTKVEGADNKE